MKGCSPPSDPDAGIRPPARPYADASPGGGQTLTFAVHQFYFGTRDPETDQQDPAAWKRIGFDVDQRCTTFQDAGFTSPTCKPPAKLETYLDDGDKCRDNNFGKYSSNLLSINAKFEPTANQRIDDGYPTMIVQLDDVGMDSCDPHAPGRVYIAAQHDPLLGTLGWDGTDAREVDSRSVLPDGGLKAPRLAFPKGYITDDTWVSGEIDASTQPLILPLGAYLFELHASALVLTMKLSKDRKKVESSTIFAVVSPDELIAAVGPAAISFVGCAASPVVDAVIQSLKQYSDLSSDAGSFQDPTRACDLISFAMGLEWKAVQAPTKVVTPPVVPLPCDGGLPDGSGGSGGTAGSPADAGPG